MTTENNLPPGGQARVNLAMQVAGIAAQVTSALRSGDTEKRTALADKLTQAHDQLVQGTAPEGLVPFIELMCSLLRGENTSLLVGDLSASYRAVYDQIVDETTQHADDGELTVHQVLDEVQHNVVVAIKQGTNAQRRMMANTLLKMQRESLRRPDLRTLIDFLDAARALLQDADWAPAAGRLSGPFQAKWEELLEALRE